MSATKAEVGAALLSALGNGSETLPLVGADPERVAAIARKGIGLPAPEPPPDPAALEAAAEARARKHLLDSARAERTAALEAADAAMANGQGDAAQQHVGEAQRLTALIGKVTREAPKDQA